MRMGGTLTREKSYVAQEIAQRKRLFLYLPPLCPCRQSLFNFLLWKIIHKETEIMSSCLHITQRQQITSRWFVLSFLPLSFYASWGTFQVPASDHFICQNFSMSLKKKT